MTSVRLPTLVLLFGVFVTACGGGTPVPADGGTSADGATDGNVVLAPGQMAWGVVTSGAVMDPAHDFYFIDVPVDGDYAFLFASTTDLAIEAVLYSDEARTMPIRWMSRVDGLFHSMHLAPGRNYVRVGAFLPDPPPMLRSYAILPMRIVDEGSAAVPVQLGDPSTMHTVGRGGTSYYVFDAPATGAYPLGDSWNRSGAVVVEFFKNADFGTAPVATCDYPLGFTGSCSVDGLPEGRIGVRVRSLDGEWAAFRFDPVHTLGEGEKANPIPLTFGTAWAGAVDAWSHSYYRFHTGGSAGSVSLTLTGIAQWSTSRIAVFAPGGTTAFAECQVVDGAVCVVSGLEANTDYRVQITEFDGPYSLLATQGTAEGSTTSPVPLADGVTHAVTMESGSKSFYTFTPSASGFYTLDFQAMPTTTTTSLRVLDAFGAAVAIQECPVSSVDVCHVGALDAGVTYYVEVGVYGSTNATLSLTFANPWGEGTPTSPVLLVPDVDHTGTLETTSYGSEGNYYAFDTDADGGRYGIAIASDGDNTAGLVGAVGTTLCALSTPVRSCIFEGLPANTRVVFRVPSQGLTANHAIRLRLFDLDEIQSCPPGTVTCHDFESGSIPAGFGDASPGAAKPWHVVAGAGVNASQGYSAGSLGPSCFEFTPTVGTFTVSLAVSATSTAATDRMRFYVDGQVHSSFAAGTDPAFQRWLVAIDPSSSHVVRTCFEMADATTHAATVDFIGVR